jgi:hypothetical protein
MKMVKGVLLGTAAGFVAVSAGQAAELPVKAKPVEYVKVCSIYGAGFYYMPGTDMCIKIGGYTRAEAADAVNGSPSWGPFNGNTNTRATSNLTVRAKGYITADAREETEYGIARAYISVGLQTSTIGLDNASNTFKSQRAFLQWAGFTVGLARSFYDFYNATALNYRDGFIPTEDTADAGWWVWGYTAVFGGGMSATVSAEARRMTTIVADTSIPAASFLVTNAGIGSGYGGWNAPDVVANLRIDQTWGSAQIMAAGHQANALYYGNLASNGHPGDAWGWVAGAGFHLNTPVISQGDYLEGEFNYTEGALRYITHSANTTMTFANGGEQSFGILSDCVFGGSVATGSVLPAVNGTGCEKTTGWSAVLAYEHYWTPQWHQSFTGAFMQVNYGDAANNMLCAFQGQGTGIGSTAVARAGCDNNWNYWVVGSRLQWDVTKSFYLGVEALYLQQDTASSATGFVPAAAGLGAPTLCSTGVCRTSNENTWVFTLRMHKDFLP